MDLFVSSITPFTFELSGTVFIPFPSFTITFIAYNLSYILLRFYKTTKFIFRDSRFNNSFTYKF